jgi:large subunit ribosomal protein L22
MQVTAKARYIRMSPRKVRLVVDVIRGLDVVSALDQLNFMNKRARLPVMKLLNSAIANAENNFELDKNNLYIKEIRVDEGPTLRRWRPRAFGRAAPIRKRTSHISIVLAEIVDTGQKEGKKPKVEAPLSLDKKPKQEPEPQKVEDKKEGKKETEEKKETKSDPRREGHGKHTKIEGKGAKAVGSKFFRRKSG